MKGFNKIKTLLILSVLTIALSALALGWKVVALKKVLVAAAVTDPVVAAVEPTVVLTNTVMTTTNFVTSVVTNYVTVTNEVAVPAENYVFSWTLPDGKKINGLSKIEPVPVRITEISDTNLAFYVIFDAKGGKKDVCYYELTSPDGFKWSGVWEQTSPYFSGTCYADRINDGVWRGQFATPTESPMFKIEKRE
jgi:hypothetical protein